MMLRKSIIAALSILVAVATAHPYNSEWNNAARYRWNDLFAARAQEVGARVMSQARVADVEKTSCATVTETRPNGDSYKVRVCAADAGDAPNKVCLGTRVTPCCPTDDFLRGNLQSIATVSINEEDVTVRYYLTQDTTAGEVCFRLDDAHLRAETCSRSRLAGISCLPPCSKITTTCFNNTLTGDSSSCDGNVCQCKTGYLPPECCQCDTTNFYLPDCRPFCRGNCSLFRPANLGGCDTCRAGFTGAPECCECEPGKTFIDGVCKCDIREPDGTCAEGALEPDCCECDTTGNTTHAFYKNENDKCIPFCKSNCAVIGSSGCTTCKDGFMREPDCCECVLPGQDEVTGVCKCSANLRPDGSCIPEAKPEDCCECITGYQINPTTGRCEPERCDKQQQLFFYIDATSSNTFENFCPLMVVMQMLVAAFNPSSTSGTQVATLLFSDNANNKEPSPVFDMNTPCFDAVQGSGRSLSSLMIDFGICLDNGRNYDSTLFPSLCGEGTSAVKGLQEILRLASASTRSSAEGAIVMLTDGIIMDDALKRTEVLNSLKSARIRTLIAAGIDGANEANLRLYTSSDNNILVGTDAVQLGIDIVNKMQERGIVCQDHADSITRSLNEAERADINLFCQCHRNHSITLPICQRKYPTCGGSLSFELPNLPSGSARSRTQNNDALEYMNRLLIEEEILAAVEKVLEQRHHG